MKKLFVCLFAVMLVAGVTSMAMARGGIAIGDFEVDARAGAAAIDADGARIPNGRAFGVSGAVGGAAADADGFVLNGLVEGDVDAIGGALTNTDSYRWNNPVPRADRSIGVGSASSSEAVTGASIKVKVDPDGFFALGGVDADMHGFAAQGTLNKSRLGESPRFDNNTDGRTGGIAAQGSIGSFEGSASAGSLGDLRIFRHNIDSKAGAGAGAEIEMWGSSYSESYRFFDRSRGAVTTGMGTNVGAFTEVRSSGYDYDWDKGLSDSGADVSGSWIAAGKASTSTTQVYNGPGTIGGANASATGGYLGAGSLGSNYSGSVVGHSQTTVMTVRGMNGSVNTSSAGMSVTSTVN